jgi:hypothetical protein
MARLALLFLAALLCGALAMPVVQPEPEDTVADETVLSTTTNSTETIEVRRGRSCLCIVG